MLSSGRLRKINLSVWHDHLSKAIPLHHKADIKNVNVLCLALQLNRHNHSLLSSSYEFDEISTWREAQQVFPSNRDKDSDSLSVSLQNWNLRPWHNESFARTVYPSVLWQSCMRSKQRRQIKAIKFRSLNQITIGVSFLQKDRLTYHDVDTSGSWGFFDTVSDMQLGFILDERLHVSVLLHIYTVSFFNLFK